MSLKKVHLRVSRQNLCSWTTTGRVRDCVPSASNQSDAGFGMTAAVAEALLRSHAGEISFLPALPPSWPTGSISGLRARGGSEVAIQWKDGMSKKCMAYGAATLRARASP